MINTKMNKNTMLEIKQSVYSNLATGFPHFIVKVYAVIL